jgi:phage gp45-like
MSLDLIRKGMEKVKGQMQLMVGRCVLKAAKSAGLMVMQIEALEGETIDGAERLENYGLAGFPPGGSEGVFVEVGGSRDHPITVAMENRGIRPALENGEVKVYSMFNQLIHLDKNGDLIIDVPNNMTIKTKNLTITAPDDVNVTGNINSTADIKDKKSTMQSMRDTYNPHTHGGPTPDRTM